MFIRDPLSNIKNICNISCDVNPGISLNESSLQIPGLTSLPSTLIAKKSIKMKFLADKIYYNFSQENSKITNI